MPQHDLSQTLVSPAVQGTIAAVAIALVLLLLRELPKIPRRLLGLMAAAFVDMVGVFFVVPLMPYWSARLGEGTQLFGMPLGPGTVTGLVMATYTVAQSASAPLWGRVSDRCGRRPALLVALGASAAAYVVFAFADSLWVLLLSRVVQGAGGGTVGVIQAYVADTVAPEERARSLGWLSAATNLGVALGPVLGSYAMALGPVDLLPGDAHWAMGSAAPGLLAALLCVLNVVAVARWLRESRADHEHGPRTPMLRALASVAAQPAAPASRLLLIYGFAIGAGQGIHAVMALLLKANFAIGEHQIGTVFTWIGAISVFARVFVLGRLVDRLGEARLSRLGLVVLATAIGALPFANSLATLALAVGLLPVGMALTFPCVSGLLSRVVPAADRGMILGLQQTFGNSARFAAQVSFGWLFDHAGHGTPFAVAAGCVLLTLPLGFGLHRFSRQGPAPVRPAAP